MAHTKWHGGGQVRAGDAVARAEADALRVYVDDRELGTLGGLHEASDDPLPLDEHVREQVAATLDAVRLLIEREAVHVDPDTSLLVSFQGFSNAGRERPTDAGYGDRVVIQLQVA